MAIFLGAKMEGILRARITMERSDLCKKSDGDLLNDLCPLPFSCFEKWSSSSCHEQDQVYIEKEISVSRRHIFKLYRGESVFHGKQRGLFRSFASCCDTHSRLLLHWYGEQDILNLKGRRTTVSRVSTKLAEKVDHKLRTEDIIFQRLSCNAGGLREVHVANRICMNQVLQPRAPVACGG